MANKVGAPSTYYFETIQLGESKKYYGKHSSIKSAAYMYASRHGVKLSTSLEMEKGDWFTIVTRIK